MSSVRTLKRLPISSSAIAEHSRCDPGRPRPNGASHAAPTDSSSASTFFQRAKSLGSSLAYSSLATRAPTLIWRVSPRQPPVGRELGEREIDRPVIPLVRHTALQQPLYERDHLRDVLRRARV